MKFLLSLAAIVGVSAAGRGAIAIEFDYSLDAISASPFFPVSSPARQTLEAAGVAIGTYLNDSLASITPSGGNTWTAEFFNPTSGTFTSVENPTINGNTIRIYVGARNLGSGVLGEGGPGGFSASGSGAFGSSVAFRGQDATGATLDHNSTDFGPWGGSVAFNNSGVNWFYESTGLHSVTVPEASVDFYSVALHEVVHVLGFGTSLSWDHYVTTGPNRFNGPQSTSFNGGTVPLQADRGHWVNGTTSTLPGMALLREAAMDPSIGNGVRKPLTVLDWAGLDDVGWDVASSQLAMVPEPAEMAVAASFALMGFGLWRRRFKGNRC
jgi:hypothetical protein